MTYLEHHIRSLSSLKRTLYLSFGNCSWRSSSVDLGRVGMAGGVKYGSSTVDGVGSGEDVADLRKMCLPLKKHGADKNPIQKLEDL